MGSKMSPYFHNKLSTLSVLKQTLAASRTSNQSTNRYSPKNILATKNKAKESWYPEKKTLTSFRTERFSE